MKFWKILVIRTKISIHLLHYLLWKDQEITIENVSELANFCTHCKKLKVNILSTITLIS